MSIAARLERLTQKIAAAAAKGRQAHADIRLVAVTKGVRPDRIEEAVAAGVTDIGENKVQELLPKYEFFKARQLSAGLVWHFVGSLQRNKVRHIVGLVDLIQSVDRLSLLEEIDKKAAQKDIIQRVLVQVNIAGEATKHGISPVELIPFLVDASKLEHVKVDGLMTIAPLTTDSKALRGVFSKMRRVFEDARRAAVSGVEMRYLSMGMTQDFEVAIEEKANMVRVGRALFR